MQMQTVEKEKFKFPDEQEKEVEAKEELEIEVIDDTPPEDRGREPMPKEMVKELEEDDLEEYSDKVKKRLSQLKKVWHDERREKEAALREREEALRLVEAKVKDFNKLQAELTAGRKTFSDEMTKAVSTEVASAKDKLKQAYESGDPELIANAQEALTDAKIRLKELEYRKAPLQEQEPVVETQQQRQEPQPVRDPKAESWRAKNTWFGVDEEMTSLALGLHEKLVRSNVDPRSDDYYRRIDETMRKRFPEYFDGDTTEVDTEEQEAPTKAKSSPRKSATVVAPATRSTAPKKVRLTQTQLALAKKFGLTPEQYAKELIKMENNNG
jgi:hypothetical protein